MGSPKRPNSQVPDPKEALVALNFRVPFQFRQRMKLAATVQGVSMTQLLTDAIDTHLGVRLSGDAVPQRAAAADGHLVDEILQDLKK
jgi:hypothetical protein